MKNVELAGIDTNDYPDFSDVYISYAEHDNGRPYTEGELEAIEPGEVYSCIISLLF